MFNGLLETTKRKAEELAKESKIKVMKTYEETSSSVKKKLANKEVSITLAQLKELKSGRSEYVLLDNGLKLVLKEGI